MSDIFPIKNHLKQEDVLSPSLFFFALEHVIRKVQARHEGLKLNGTHQIHFNLMGLFYRVIAYTP